MSVTKSTSRSSTRFDTAVTFRLEASNAPTTEGLKSLTNLQRIQMDSSSGRRTGVLSPLTTPSSSILSKKTVYSSTSRKFESL